MQINSQWGTVCSNGWTQRAASLVCNQLGLVLNPGDWQLFRSDIPHPGTNDPIMLTYDNLFLAETQIIKHSLFLLYIYF